MTPQLGDTAPDFEAETTRGPIRFHEWLGGSRGVLFSRPADFAPVCTTELGAVARLKGEFGRRGTEVMGLPVDPVESHLRWESDIGETQGDPGRPGELPDDRRMRTARSRHGTDAHEPLDRGHPAVRHAANPTNSPHRGHGGEGAAPAWARRQRN